LKKKLKNIPEKFLWTFAFLLVALAYLFGLFVDITGDSGLYAAIARQMVESGDWFSLKINGELYDQKPHLFFWLTGLGIKLFGNTNFAFKLFPFLYGAAGIYFTYRLGKQVYAEKTGKLAALISGTSQIFFLYFFDFHTDTVLQTGVVLALWQLAAYLQTQKPINFVLGFLGVGLAMLSKGPIGAVLPFFAILFYLIAERDFKQLFHVKWFFGIVIAFIVISPSLLHLYNSFGVMGLKFFFITNNVGRVTGSYAGSSTDYFYAFHTILWAFLPWTIFVVAALYSTLKDWFLRNSDLKWSYYLLGGVLILLFILSIAKGKAPNYFMIAVAPISIVAANWISKFDSFSIKIKKRLLVLQTILIGLISASFIYILVVFTKGQILFSSISVVLYLSVAIMLVKFKMNSFKKVILASVFGASILNLMLNVKILPDLFAYQGARQVLKLYEENNLPQTQLYNFELEEYNLFFYAKKPVENIDNWDVLYKTVATPGTWLYTNEIKLNDILSMDFNIDTVYQIRQRGMNRINLEFLNPATREQSLKTNYLIVTGSNKGE
jgi:4-amino-4-deoxy-L-arabinose transferase-like glycosyltransferase